MLVSSVCLNDLNKYNFPKVSRHFTLLLLLHLLPPHTQSTASLLATAPLLSLENFHNHKYDDKTPCLLTIGLDAHFLNPKVLVSLII
jgi:hypothetical protein